MLNRRWWRYPILALVLCLHAPSALAQVPDLIIRRIADLYVREAENSYLSQSRQIDDHTYSLRRDSIDAELDILAKQLQQFSDEDQERATSQISGLTKARLAILEPQWSAKAEQLKQQRADHDRTLIADIATDARRALEPQRRRALLQQRLDRGEITADDFTAEDTKALDEIMAFRSKYLAEGEGYATRFDRELALLTEAIAKNPATPLPESKVPAGSGGTSAADYQRDVLLAADINFRLSIVRDHYWVRKDMSDATFRETEHVLSTDLSRLIAKWRAAGKGPQFERDYRQGHVATGAATKSAAGRSGGKTTHPPATKPSAPNEMFFIVVGVLLWVGAMFLIFGEEKEEPAPAPRPVSTVHGTAHYAPLQLDVADPMCLAKGLFFGKSSGPERRALPFDAPGAPICSTPEHHTLIVARTRTGKGTRVIVPTLLRYSGSALVIDPKGENAAITARVRKLHLRQNIHVLNPWNELAGTYEALGLARATYNPLDVLDRMDPNVVALAQTMAGAICPAPASAKDRFWQGSAANVLTAVLLWLSDQPGEQKTLARVRQIISLTRKEFTAKYLTAMAASDAFEGAIREMAAPFIDLADETYSGIMSNLSESTKFLSDPQIKLATAQSSFSMEDLATGKVTVYVVIPTERMDTQATWLRLIIAAGMHIFKHPRTKIASRHRCLFLIDEFAALGRLDDLPRDIATMSGFGVDFALIVQGLDQLKDHYGEARGAILSNCAYKWFCNVNDLDSAKYLSDILGKTTVATQSTSASSSSSGGGQHSTYSNSETTSHSETARSLLNPDEVLNLGRNVAILLQPQGHPHYLCPVDYWNTAKAFVSLRDKHPSSLYWDPPLAYDQNPYIAPPPPPLPHHRGHQGVVPAGDGG